MAGFTPVYSWPYPAGIDSPDARVYLKNLALAMEATVRGIDLVAAGLSGLTTSVAALDGAWTDWSSSMVIGASTTPPTKGSLTTYTAIYKQTGKTTTFSFGIAINTGGGFSAGSGVWYIPVPVAATVNAKASTVGIVGGIDIGTTLLTGHCYFDPAASGGLAIALTTLGGNALGSSGPGTAYATGDIIRGSIRYENV